MKEIIYTHNAPEAIGPYSQAIAKGGLLFLSGQLPIDPDTGLIPEGIEKQTERSLKNAMAIIRDSGASRKDVVKTTVFLKDMKDFSAMNAVYQEFFMEEFPARSAVEVAGLPKGALVEIEMIVVY
ncbi:MAG: RidA family protein [Clostridia bacterium]|nr:RidA family protein [Clostridia bacterium]